MAEFPSDIEERLMRGVEADLIHSLTIPQTVQQKDWRREEVERGEQQ